MHTKKNFETILFDTCSSTMDEAKKFAKENTIEHLFCVATKSQTNGRGRGGSIWIQAASPEQEEKGRNNFYHYPSLWDAMEASNEFLPLTLIIPRNKLKVPIEWLSIIVGCALYDALNQVEKFINNTFSNFSFLQHKNNYYIKWPNDLITYPDCKKISGILCETSFANGNINEIYIGIGLNLFNSPKLENSTSFYESLFINQLTPENKKQILKSFVNYFCLEIEEFLFHSRTVDQIKHLAFDRMLPKGTPLSVNKGEFKGKFSGLGNNGALILEGVKQPIYSGDIFVEPSMQNVFSMQRQSKPIKKTENPKISFAGRILQKTKLKMNSLKVNKQNPAIAIDFGNSRIHLANKNSLGTVKYADFIYENEAEFSIILKMNLKLILENLIEDKNKEIPIYYSSVNTKEKTENTLSHIITYFKTIFPSMKFKTLKITENEIFSKISLKGQYDFQRLGADRALKFYFAYHEAIKLNKNILIISFGTATTCEGVSKNGEILENFVFPGIQMSFNALHNYTALLPSLKADFNHFTAEGKYWNQEIYMQRGVFMSALGSVLLAAHLHEPCLCYFHGGDAQQVIAIFESLLCKIKLSIQHKLISNLETTALFEIGDLFNQESLLESTLESPNRLEDFRKIGGRIENTAEDRFDMHMAHKFKFHSREQWRERISNGDVLIEHNAPKEINYTRTPTLNRVKPTYKMKNYDQIWLFHPPESEPEFVHTINTIFDNQDICIFAKPPHLVVHAAGLYLKNTFVENIAKMGFENCSPVHRIDRETSGILICARKPETRKVLSEAFRHSQVKKMYLAVTKGTRQLPQQFKVTLPIGEPENSLIRLKLWVNGKNSQPASTHFTKLAQIDDYTLFACSPITGRTNQIRIHLAAIGHWIVGDKMYFEDENVFIEFYEKGLTQWVHKQVLFSRHMLHNTGILFDVKSKCDVLSSQPIICPIPQDMLEFPKLKDLMKQANLSLNITEQVSELNNIFYSIHNSNILEEIT